MNYRVVNDEQVLWEADIDGPADVAHFPAEHLTRPAAGVAELQIDGRVVDRVYSLALLQATSRYWAEAHGSEG